MVTEGTITRSATPRRACLRDNVVVYEGKIGSLRRFKDDVSEVKSASSAASASRSSTTSRSAT
jgi:translation initiation factor IF-2